MDVALVTGALAKAEAERLPPAARAYLYERAVKHGESGADRYNLGGLLDTRFGSGATPRLATFGSWDEGCAALVSTAYRAAPRRWGDADDVELKRLGTYPAGNGPPTIGDIADVLRSAVATVSPATDILLFAPSAAQEEAFRRLVADWAGYESIGVGDRVFVGEEGRVNLRPDLADWRVFRDQWKAGSIPANELPGRLNVQVGVSNKVRKYLAEAKVVDPALASAAHDATGVDVEKSSNALAAAASVEESVKKVGWLDFITRPGDKINLPVIGGVPDKYLWLAGAGFAGLVTLSVVRIIRAR